MNPNSLFDNRTEDWPVIEARFWRYVQKGETGECWIWKGTVSRYGQIRLRNGKTARAHRVAYELFNGPIPEGFTIDHLCMNKLCVNPEHLEAVTSKENTHRGLAILGSPKSYMTHCKRGHRLSKENLDPSPAYGKFGYRSCMVCKRERIESFKKMGWYLEQAQKIRWGMVGLEG